MKNFRTFLLSLMAVALLTPATIKAQEEEAAEEAASPFSVGMDLVSSYIWRGTQVHGASLQPYAAATFGGFEIGAWGAYEIAANWDGVPAEADLYLSYGFDFGLSVGLTDYYYPGGAGWFETSDTAGTHAFEINLGYEISGFTIAANYLLNEAGFAASDGSDLYFELGYSYKNLSAFIGAGNGWHTGEEAAGETPNDDGTFDDKFAIVNIGVTITTDSKFPVFGGIVLNPYTETFNVVAGISF